MKFLPVTLAIAICAATAIIAVLQIVLNKVVEKAKGQKNRLILLLGLPGSGASSIFQAIATASDSNGRCGRLVPRTLAQPEVMDLFKDVSILQVEQHLLSMQEVRRASGIIFVVDASARRVPEAASYLYEILMSPEYQANPPALCLAFSHLSEPGAEHRTVLRESLEQEIDRLRVSWTPYRQKGHTLMHRLGLRKANVSDHTPFRFAHVRAAFFTLAQESSFEALAQLCTGFCQRASLLR